MYFPKSQIKTNLYTKGGELTKPSNGEDYVGFYFKTSTGDFYTGKHPQDLPTIKLNSTEAFEYTNPNSTPEPLPDNSPIPIWTWEYYGTPLPKTSPPSQPFRVFPILTDVDYTLGEFQRYFLSKTNEPYFIEVNEEQYQRYLDQDKNVAYQLYQPLSFPWNLTGDRNNTYKVNEATINRVERDNKTPGFKSYFKNRFDQFYK